MNKSHCYFLGENQPKFHEPWQIHATRKMDEVSCIQEFFTRGGGCCSGYSPTEGPAAEKNEDELSRLAVLSLPKHALTDQTFPIGLQKVR